MFAQYTATTRSSHKSDEGHRLSHRTHKAASAEAQSPERNRLARTEMTAPHHWQPVSSIFLRMRHGELARLGEIVLSSIIQRTDSGGDQLSQHSPVSSIRRYMGGQSLSRSQRRTSQDKRFIFGRYVQSKQKIRKRHDLSAQKPNPRAGNPTCRCTSRDGCRLGSARDVPSRSTRQCRCWR